MNSAALFLMNVFLLLWLRLVAGYFSIVMMVQWSALFLERGSASGFIRQVMV